MKEKSEMNSEEQLPPAPMNPGTSNIQHRTTNIQGLRVVIPQYFNTEIYYA